MYFKYKYNYNNINPVTNVLKVQLFLRNVLKYSTLSTLKKYSKRLQLGKKEQGMCAKKKLAPALVSAVGWGPMLAQCR